MRRASISSGWLVLVSLCVATGALAQEGYVGWTAPAPPAPPPPTDPSACPAGQEVGSDTQGHCCWPGQAWSSLKAHCIGPPLCGAGMIAKGEECVPDCPEGQTINADTAGHCCFPGQAWSSARNLCIGAPVCPPGMTATPDGCLLLTAPPLPAPVAPPPRPSPYQPGPPPPPPQSLPPLQNNDDGMAPPPPPPEEQVDGNRRDRGGPRPRRLPQEGEEADAEEDENAPDYADRSYLKMGHVFFHLSVAYNFTDVVAGPGLGLEIVVWRTNRITLGVDSEMALMTSQFFNASRKRWVVPFRLGALFGFRLLSSHTELVLHSGLLETYSGLGYHVGPEPWSSRIYAGLQINLRFGSGKGYLFGSVDIVGVDGLDVLARVGYAF